MNDKVRSDSGRSLIGLLAVVVVLAGLGAAVLVANQDSTGGAHHGLSLSDSGTTLKASPGAAAADINAAAVEACRSDYQSVTQAVGYFQALNGRPPASLADLSGILKDPVTSSYFTISVAPPAGQVRVATPGHPGAPGDANCSYAGLAR